MEPNAFDIVHQADQHEIDIMMTQLLAEPGTSSSAQFRVRHKDGSWCWLEATTSELPSGSDVPEFVIVLRDISARKQAETEGEQLLARIMDQAREVQFIVNTVPEGIFMVGEAGEIRLTNPIAWEHLALLAPEWNNGRLTHLANRPLAELLTSPPKGLWHELESNGRFFELIARPIEDGPGHRGWVFVLHDVTSERQVKNVSLNQTFGFGVRVLVKGSWGFAASSEVTRRSPPRYPRSRGHTMNNPYRVWPSILNVVGMALLLANQGLITLPNLHTWWPAILIGLGIKWLVWPRKSCRYNRNTQQVQP